MPAQKPMMDDGGGGAVDEADNGNEDTSNDYEPNLDPPGNLADRWNVSLSDSPQQDCNTSGLTLRDQPDMPDPAPYLDLGHKLDDRWNDTRTYETPATKDDPAHSSFGGWMQQHDLSVNIGSGLGFGPSMSIAPQDGQHDYQLNISFPNVKTLGRAIPYVGETFSAQFGWGDSGKSIGVQGGLDFLPFGLASVSAGADANLSDPWKSDLTIQMRIFNVSPQLKVTAEGLLDYLQDMQRQIYNLYGAP
jgi:hypothetical protein